MRALASAEVRVHWEEDGRGDCTFLQFSVSSGESDLSGNTINLGRNAPGGAPWPGRGWGGGPRQGWSVSVTGRRREQQRLKNTRRWKMQLMR